MHRDLAIEYLSRDIQADPQVIVKAPSACTASTTDNENHKFCCHRCCDLSPPCRAGVGEGTFNPVKLSTREAKSSKHGGGSPAASPSRRPRRQAHPESRRTKPPPPRVAPPSPQGHPRWVILCLLSVLCNTLCLALMNNGLGQIILRLNCPGGE